MSGFDDDYYADDFLGEEGRNFLTNDVRKGGLVWYMLLCIPFIFFHAVAWSVHRRYRARMQATRENRAEDKSFYQNLREKLGRSVDRHRVLPQSAIEINMHPTKGRKPPEPKDGKAAASPSQYEGFAKTGLVVKLSDAIDHCKERLDSKCRDNACADKKHDPTPTPDTPTRLTRYVIKDDTPFVMLSSSRKLKDKDYLDYSHDKNPSISLLKDEEEGCPHGHNAIISLLQQLETDGWEYLWWDWMVTHGRDDSEKKGKENANEKAMKEKEKANNLDNYHFEKAMKWAEINAREVIALWRKQETVGVNMHLTKGSNRRGPKDGKAAASEYTGNAVNQKRLVVKVSDAIEHWKRGLYRENAYKDQKHDHPTRYEIDDDTPFVMISYNSKLKNERYPHGHNAIISLLQQLETDGWEYLWWDWMVTNDRDDFFNTYDQKDFEPAMFWAQDHAFEVIVLWPKPSDALDYLQRPWCLSEILACTKRGTHVVYSQATDFWLSKKGAGCPCIYEKIFFPIVLAASEAYTSFFYFSTTLIMATVIENDEGESLGGGDSEEYSSSMEWIPILLWSFYIAYCVMFVRYYLDKWLGSGPTDSYHLYFPVDFIEYLTNENAWKKDDAAKFKLVYNLCKVGHLTGVMYDLGDTIGCGGKLGFTKPWRFSFEQATIKWKETCLGNRKKFADNIKKWCNEKLEKWYPPPPLDQKEQENQKKQQAYALYEEKFGVSENAIYEQDLLAEMDEIVKKKQNLPWLQMSNGRPVLKRKDALKVKGLKASWLNGESSEMHDENEAVSKSFTGVEMLWFSCPTAYQGKVVTSGVQVNLAIFTPMTPLQYPKITTYLKKPLFIGEGEIRAFYILNSIMATCAMPAAAYAGGGTALLISIVSLTPHFMMATGYLTLVSGSKLNVFCSMVSCVQVGFLFFQILITAMVMTDSSWVLWIFYTLYFLWCTYQGFVAVSYLVYNLFTKLIGMGENVSFRMVC